MKNYGVFTSKHEQAFISKTREVEVIKNSFPSKTEKTYVLFDDKNESCQFVADEKISNGDILYDLRFQQRFIVSSIAGKASIITVEYQDKNGPAKHDFQCNTAILSKL